MARRKDPRPLPQRLEDLTHERDALELRLGGASYRAIADHQGCHPSVAHDRVQRALARLVPVETAEQVRSTEAERLDAVASRLLHRIGACDRDDLLPSLSAAYVRVVDRKAKLLGLDTPVVQRVSLTTELDSEIEALMAALRGDEAAAAQLTEDAEL